MIHIPVCMPPSEEKHHPVGVAHLTMRELNSGLRVCFTTFESQDVAKGQERTAQPQSKAPGMTGGKVDRADTMACNILQHPGKTLRHKRFAGSNVLYDGTLPHNQRTCKYGGRLSSVILSCFLFVFCDYFQQGHTFNECVIIVPLGR